MILSQGWDKDFYVDENVSKIKRLVEVKIVFFKLHRPIALKRHTSKRKIRAIILVRNYSYNYHS